MDLALQLARILDVGAVPDLHESGDVEAARSDLGGHGGRKVDHLLLYGSQRAGSAIPWLTGWPVTREAVGAPPWASRTCC